MTIQEFLNKFIEGYLFEDLNNMSKIKSKPPKRYGEAGYPMLMTTLAGIELLGTLLYSKAFKPKAGDNHFKNYWNNYLCPYNQNYRGMSKFFRQLVRHGLAHTFLAKPGIHVIKRYEKLHMTRDSARGYMYIHAVSFFKDFRKSYLEKVKPLLKNKDPLSVSLRTNMQSRLDEIIKIYSQDSSRFKSNMLKLSPTNYILPMNSGVSTSIIHSIQNFGTSPIN